MAGFGALGPVSQIAGTTGSSLLQRQQQTPAYDPTFWDKLAGYTDPNTGFQHAGMGSFALDTIGGLSNLYLGLKQYGLARDTFNQRKGEFERNFQAQRQLTNSSLEDRQRARVASNPTAYRSVGDYMKQYGI